jgi:glycosyltransferase involved in cell wall biosynthesis
MVAPTSFFADYGCHVRILEEVRALQAQGHIVRVVTYHNGDNLPGIDIKRTVGLPWRTRLMVGSSRHKIYLDVMLFFAVFRQALSFKPAVIHAHLHEGALIGSVVGKLLRKPVVFDYQGSLTEEMLDHRFIRPGGLRERVVRRLERLIDRLPSVIVPSGTAAHDHLLSRGVPEQRIRLLTDAVDISRFDPERYKDARLSVRAKLGIPSHARVVVYLGLLAEYQGTSLLIDAARLLLQKHPDLYFIIAGYPGVDHYVQYAASGSHADRMLFPGRVAYRDAPALLAAGDVAVAPKQSSTEGNGKLFNYMAMGLPIVAIDTSPNRLILADLGHLIHPGDPHEFALAIERAFQDTSEQRSNLRTRVSDQFSWRERVLDLENIYADVLGKSGEITRHPASNGKKKAIMLPPDTADDISVDHEPVAGVQVRERRGGQ